MTKKDHSRSERIFRALLRVFPFDFRWKHGREMEQVFRTQQREERRQGGTMGTLKLWWATLADIARTAPREHLEMLAQDAGYALRLMRKNLGFTTVAVLTLALGIGANTAIFSVLNNIFLRPLPFRESDRLVRVLDYMVAPNGERRTFSVWARNFALLEAQNRVFERVVAQRGQSFSLIGGEEPERVSVIGVSPQWSSTLGVRLGLGRAFSPEEERLGQDSGVILISHSLWQRRFGGSRDALGTTVTLNDRSYTIVGVLPPGFRYPNEADLWTPVTLDPIGSPSVGLNVVGRLKPDVTLEQVQAELEAIAQRLQETYRDTNKGFGLIAVPFRENLFGDDGRERIALLLLGVVGFFLLIACINVANLLLARFVSRQKEVAIRAALGAGRARQFRQFLTESILLSLLGGASGFLLFHWLGQYLVVLVPPVLSDQLPLGEVGVDERVLGFSLLLSLLAGVVFGLAPAFRAANPNLQGLLKEGGRSSGAGGHRRMLGALVVCEIALALVLLSGAGIMIKNLQRLQRVDLGFQPENLLTMQFDLSDDRYASAQQRAVFVRSMLTAVEGVPGVVEAGITSVNPLCCGDWGARIAIKGLETASVDETFVVHHRYITPGLITAMGIRLLKGRRFTEQDREGSQDVVIIDERMARRYWPGENPIGKQVRRASQQLDNPWLTVVGVVGAVQDAGDHDETWYLPYFKNPLARSTDTLHLMVRTSSRPYALVRSVQSAIWEIDKNLALYETTVMDRLHAETLAQDRMGTVILGLFAAFGLTLAGLGIYGVMSYAVGQQTHEFGVRMALGAQAGDILALVLRRGLLLALGGVALGLAGALLLAQALSGVVTEISATEPTPFLGAAFLLTLVALLACYIPARRATKVDPMVALRYE